jgi:hypothetical protein
VGIKNVERKTTKKKKKRGQKNSSPIFGGKKNLRELERK